MSFNNNGMNVPQISGNGVQSPYTNEFINQRFSQPNQQFTYNYPNSYYGNQQNQWNQSNQQISPNQNNQNSQPQVYFRFVTSEEEAKAAIPNLDGSLNVFAHLSQGKIYTKQLEIDGNAPLRTYVLVTESNQQNQINSPVTDTNEFVSKKEFDELYSLYIDMDKDLQGLSKDFDMYLNNATKDNKSAKGDKK